MYSLKSLGVLKTVWKTIIFVLFCCLRYKYCSSGICSHRRVRILECSHLCCCQMTEAITVFHKEFGILTVWAGMTSSLCHYHIWQKICWFSHVPIFFSVIFCYTMYILDIVRFLLLPKIMDCHWKASSHQ